MRDWPNRVVWLRETREMREAGLVGVREQVRLRETGVAFGGVGASKQVWAWETVMLSKNGGGCRKGRGGTGAGAGGLDVVVVVYCGGGGSGGCGGGN